MRALAVALFLAMVRVTLAANATLESAEVSAAPDLAVELDLSAPVAAHGQALRAEGALPDRIFVDLPATVVGTRVPKVLTGTGPLLRVRIAQRDPSTVRIVLDLARPTPYAVRTVSRTVVISLGSPPPSTPPEPTATRSDQ
jgi:N-acetylmuramoyl-L-alanine amidase